MTPEQFCYWLQGFFELNGGRPLVTAEQSQMIQDHLNEVFKKVTPERRKTLHEVIDEIQKEKEQVRVDPYTQPGRIC